MLLPSGLWHAAQTWVAICEPNAVSALGSGLTSAAVATCEALMISAMAVARTNFMIFGRLRDGYPSNTLF